MLCRDRKGAVGAEDSTRGQAASTGQNMRSARPVQLPPTASLSQGLSLPLYPALTHFTSERGSSERILATFTGGLCQVLSCSEAASSRPSEGETAGWQMAQPYEGELWASVPQGPEGQA